MLSHISETSLVQKGPGQVEERRNTRGSEFKCNGRYLRRKNNVS